MKKLIILEAQSDINQLFYYKEKKLLNLNDYKFLSLQPCITSTLIRNKIEPFVCSQYLNNEDYQNISSKVIKIEDQIKIIEKGIPNQPEVWVKNLFFYHFRYLLFNLFWNEISIKKIFEKEKFSHVIVFQNINSLSNSPWVLPKDKFFSELAIKYCKIKNISFEIKNNKIKNKKFLNTTFIKKKIKRTTNFFIFHLFKTLSKDFNKKKTILVNNLAYNFNNACDDIYRKNKSIKFCNLLTEDSLSSAIVSFYKMLKTFIKVKLNINNNLNYDFILPSYSLAKHFEADYKPYPQDYFNKLIQNIKGTIINDFEIDIFKEINNKINSNIFKYISKNHFLSFGIYKGLKLFSPKFIISQMTLGTAGALGYFSKKKNIPSILISHGTHVKHKDIHSFREHETVAKNILIGDYSFIGVQTPFSYEMANNYLINKNQTIIKLQPVTWGHSFLKIRKDKKFITIVFASSFKPSKRFMFESAEEILDSIIDLIESVKNKKNIKLIIKFKSDPDELSKADLKDIIKNLPQNVEIVTEVPFKKILCKADLLISFSSTTIEEALVNKIPVALYGGKGRYCHIESSISNFGNNLNKPLIFIKTKENLLNYMEKLNNSSNTFMVNDNEFSIYNFSEEEKNNFADWILNKI